MEEGYDTEAEIDDLAIPITLRELRDRKQTVNMSPQSKDQGGRTFRERQKVDTPKPHGEKKTPSPAKCKKSGHQKSKVVASKRRSKMVAYKGRSKVVAYKGRSRIKKNMARCGVAIPLNLKEVVIKLSRAEDHRAEFIEALIQHELRKVRAEEEEVVILDIEPEEQVQAEEEHPTEVENGPPFVLENAADLGFLLSSYYSSWRD